MPDKFDKDKFIEDHRKRIKDIIDGAKKGPAPSTGAGRAIVDKIMGAKQKKVAG